MNYTHSKKKILIAVPHSFVYRNLVHTGLADKLKTILNYDVEFITPSSNYELRSPVGKEYVNHYIAMQKMLEPKDTPWWYNYLRKIRRWIYSLEVNNSGLIQYRLRAKILGNSLFRRLIVKIFIGLISAVFPRSSAQRNKVRKVIDSMGTYLTPSSSILKKKNFDLVIIGSPGHNNFDWLIAWQAKKAGIPVICIMNSWDNMITKGPFMIKTDKILVWNSEMREQGIRLHGLSWDEIQPVGALQLFEYGFEKDTDEDKKVLTNLGILSDKYIIYLGSQRAPEYEIEDLMILIELLKKSNKLNKTRLVVRKHPQAPDTYFKTISEKNIILDNPPRWSCEGSDFKAFDRFAMKRMKILLRNAMLVVSSWGTTGLLEAAILDKPIVQLCWMDSIKHRRPEQIEIMKVLRSYEHLRVFNESKALLFSNSPGDFEDCFEIQNTNRELYSIRRRLAVSKLVVNPLSEVSDRIVAECELLLRRQSY